MRRLSWFLCAGIIAVMTICPMLALAGDDDPFGQADELYKMRYDQANVQKGIALLTKVVQNQPQEYEALWRLAKFHWFLGDRAKGNKRLPLFEKGKSYAEQAVAARENGLDGHYWLASTIGCVGQEKGIMNSLFMVGPMKKELDRCLEIDNKHADTHDVLAQLYWKVPGWPLSIGDKKKAQEEAKLAVTYDPKASDHWLHYGQIAADNKDYNTARAALQKVLALPDDPEDPESSRDDKAAARDKLKEIEGKK